MKGLLGMALGMQAMMNAQNEQWKEEILDAWEQSRKLPRKQKKKKRKELRLDWSIACSVIRL